LLAAKSSGDIFREIDIDPDDYVYGNPYFERETQ
jgi:hypothetical protein